MDKKSTAACMAEYPDEESHPGLEFSEHPAILCTFYKTEINGCEPLMPFDRELAKWRFYIKLYKEKKALEEITGESVKSNFVAYE